MSSAENFTQSALALNGPNSFQIGSYRLEEKNACQA